MSVKKYTVQYDNGSATAVFNVDTKFFTEEKAKITLEFFLWDYDEENDPIEEVIKKYALRCFEFSTRPSFDSVLRFKKEFEDLEGYCRIDGSEVINLTRMESFDFEEDLIIVKIEI